MAGLRGRIPAWFWIVSVVLLLWGVVGIAFFYLDPASDPEALAKLPAYDRDMYLSRPPWTMWVYGIAVWSGVLGAVALLLRSGLARWLFWLSLVTVVVMFGYILTTTDLIAVKGFVGAAGFPIVIAAIAAFQVWFAATAERRGWIG